MRLPKYLLAYNRAELSAPITILTGKPFIVGHVWAMKDPVEFAEFVNNYSGLGIATVTGYQIAITFGGVLTGNKIEINHGSLADIKKVLEEMCEFYKKERIDDKPGFYRKFLLV